MTTNISDRELALASFTFGPLVSERSTLFRFWAPLHDRIELVLADGQGEAMQTADDGWFTLEKQDAGAGTRYGFRLPDGLTVPDPASRHQPDDVHGLSEVIDPDAYSWRCKDWQGHEREELVLYELHVGTFTKEGTFRAAIDRLDHLSSLGVTALQLMPLADFPGRYNWGYDGALLYAPEASYGRPEDLKALVDAAHERGLSVFFDVVYNHFGPDGNYLAAYTPFFTHKHKTPWGDAINYDDEGSPFIRRLVVENALYWMTEFRGDGLRLDAVHAILDDSPEHLLHEIARTVREAIKGRPVHLVVENENNDSDLLSRNADGSPALFTAQWNDDLHHVLHIAATGETFGYYGDYTEEPDNVGKALAQGFVFQGQHMPYRGEARGKPSGHLPPTAFVSFIQNHDQVGNRATGDRVMAGLPMDVRKAMAAVMLLSPQIPMLFMGEEWSAREPFPYFCDFNDELNEAVRKGRREELSRLPGFDGDTALDPTSPETFGLAKLDWAESKTPDAEVILYLYRKLLDLRRKRITPLIRGMNGGKASFKTRGSAVSVRWPTENGETLVLRANLGDQPVEDGFGPPQGEILFGSADMKSGGRLAPWQVVVSIEEND